MEATQNISQVTLGSSVRWDLVLTKVFCRIPFFFFFFYDSVRVEIIM